MSDQGQGGENQGAAGSGGEQGRVIVKSLPEGTLSRGALTQKVTQLEAKLAVATLATSDKDNEIKRLTENLEAQTLVASRSAQAAAARIGELEAKLVQVSAAQQAAENRATNAAANQRVAEEAAAAEQQRATREATARQQAESRLAQANQQLQAAEARANAATQAQQAAEQRATQAEQRADTLRNSLNAVTANANQLNSQLTDANANVVQERARAEQAERDNARLRQFQSLGAAQKPSMLEKAFNVVTFPIWGPFNLVKNLAIWAWDHKLVSGVALAAVIGGSMAYNSLTNSQNKSNEQKPDTQAKLVAENARLRAEAQRVLAQSTTQPAAPTTVTAVASPQADLAPKAPVVDVPGFQVSKDARLAEVAIGREGNILTNYRMLTVGKGDDAKIVGEIIIEKNLTDGKVTYREATGAEALAGKTFMATKEVVVLKNVLYTSDVVYPGQNIAATVEQDGNNFKVKSIGPATAEQMALVSSGKHSYKGEPYLPDPVNGIYVPIKVLTGSAFPTQARIITFPAHEAKLNVTQYLVDPTGKVSEVTQQADGTMKATVPAMKEAMGALLQSREAPVFDGKLVSGLLNMDNQQRAALGLATVLKHQAYQRQA